MRILFIDSRDLLAAGDYARFHGSHAARIGEEIVRRYTAVGECPPEFGCCLILSHYAQERDSCAERCNIQCHIASASWVTGGAQLPDHRNRSLRGDTAGFAHPIGVEHHVPDDDDMLGLE